MSVAAGDRPPRQTKGRLVTGCNSVRERRRPLLLIIPDLPDSANVFLADLGAQPVGWGFGHACIAAPASWPLSSQSAAGQPIHRQAEPFATAISGWLCGRLRGGAAAGISIPAWNGAAPAGALRPGRGFPSARPGRHRRGLGRRRHQHHGPAGGFLGGRSGLLHPCWRGERGRCRSDEVNRVTFDVLLSTAKVLYPRFACQP